MSQVLKALPYPQMVANLFKRGASIQYDLMHAAIGLSGESGKLATADSFKNLIEELGDAEFYLEAFLQCVNIHSAVVQATASDPSFRPDFKPVFGTLCHDLHVASSELLDTTKKCWVYGRDVDPNAFFLHLASVRRVLDRAYDITGLRKEVVLDANQSKLGKRFPEGVYSGAAALARADKD